MLVARYDANDDGAIDIDGLFSAIDKCFAGVIGIGCQGREDFGPSGCQRLG